ncbi:hypothetical protein [Capillimicrobium parvum]|uniref:hypothetical protein n=1 Tax=Capillimicrobium parvum TaxID=2884022 RepID=UPI00216B2DBE|nr:hypothetical protein [Capillimicrobium parvum]
MDEATDADLHGDELHDLLLREVPVQFGVVTVADREKAAVRFARRTAMGRLRVHHGRSVYSIVGLSCDG